MTSRYRRYSRIVEPLGSPLERVVLTARYAWQLRLANGLNVMLGRDGDLAEQRLQRFVDVYAQTVARVPGRHEYVDLRYANGFAVRVKG
jgi:cell division protein FtsQ